MPSRGDIYSTTHTGIDAVNRLSVDEGGGAVIVSLSSNVSYAGVAAAWEAALNGAGGLANTYLVTYDNDLGLFLASNNAVDWEWLDDAAAYYGFTSATTFASRGHIADTLPEGAAQCLSIACVPLDSGEQVRLSRWRHGRARSVGYGRHSLWEIDAIMTRAKYDSLVSGYCSAGVLRVYQSDDVTAYSASNPDGYIEGSVYEIGRPSALDDSEAHIRASIRLAVGH